MARTAYARKGEVREHDKRATPDGIDGQAMQEIDEAIDRYIGKSRDSKPKNERIIFIRRWQARITQPLWSLLAKADLNECVEAGKATMPKLDCDGWENQVLDGDRPGAFTLDGQPAKTERQLPSWVIAAKSQLCKAIEQGKANRPIIYEQMVFAWYYQYQPIEILRPLCAKKNMEKSDTITNPQMSLLL